MPAIASQITTVDPTKKAAKDKARALVVDIPIKLVLTSIARELT
jgi:hypothetical protein